MKVVGAGLVTADIVQLTDRSWAPLSDGVGYFAGGTVCNILSYLARWGWPCSILGGTGTDALGDVLRADLHYFGVDTSGLLQRPRQPTRRIAHQIVSDGRNAGRHRFLTECPQCGAKFEPFMTPNISEFPSSITDQFSADSVLIVDRANELTLQLATRVADAGGTVIFEPGYLSRQEAIVEALIERVHLLKYSEELQWRRGRFRDTIPTKHPNLQLIIETRGATGVRALAGNREFRITTTPIMDVIDSAGAGDAFMGGFLTGLGPGGVSDLGNLSDAQIEDALKRGQALGGLACRFVAGKGVLYMRSNAEIEAAIEVTIANRRPPDGFEEHELPIGTAVPSTPDEVCRTCLLPPP